METITTDVIGEDNGRSRSPSSSPKSPHRFLRTIRNSPSIIRKKMKHTCKDHVDSPDNGVLEDHPECRVFHVLYQGKIRVATLQVHEALAAVKRLTLLYSTTSNTLEVGNSDSHVPPKSPKLSRSPKLSPMIRRKTSPKPPKKNNLKVTCKYLSIDDPKSSEVEVIPISTIAYCATDIRHPTAVAFINKDSKGGLICHVIQCDSKEKAANIVSFIGQMFESAWVEWKELHPDPLSAGRLSPSNLGRSSSFHSTSRTSSNRLTVPGSDEAYRKRPNSFNSTDDYLDMDIDDPM